MTNRDITYSVKVWVGNHDEEHPLDATSDKAARQERNNKHPGAQLWFFRRSDGCHACLD